MGRNPRRVLPAAGRTEAGGGGASLRVDTDPVFYREASIAAAISTNSLASTSAPMPIEVMRGRVLIARSEPPSFGAMAKIRGP